MLRRSPRRTLGAIVTQAVVLIVALAGSDLNLSVTKQGQSKSIELPGRHDISLLHAREVAAFSRARWQLSRARGGSADKKSGGEVDHRNESPEFATQVSLVGSPPSRSIE
jgi:hypothetical protein